MWLVTLYEDADREAFVLWMKEHEIVFNEFEFIPRVFEIEDPFDHPAIEMIEDGEWRQTRLQDRQPIIVDSLYAVGPGNWGLARTIRRDIPWSFDHSTSGISSFFEAGLDGTGVDIYVVDSGFNVAHTELAGRATNVSDHTTAGTNTDELGHGTACASLIAGLTIGTARGADLWSFRCFDGTNSGNASWSVNAINAAVAHYNGRSVLDRAAVMNLSMAGNSSATGAAATAAAQAGIVVVAAAGNDSINADNVYPASSAGILCVGGSNSHDEPYYTCGDGTNYGTQVDLLAPSYGVIVADHTGNSAYKPGRGTSYGCALTTGVVACLLTGRQRLTQSQVATVRQYVIDSATTGRFKSGPTPGDLPDRILYLDPSLISSPISL